MTVGVSTAPLVGKDLDRILALPARPVLDCERERGKRRWAPQAQALIEVMTAKFSRGSRSCKCKELGFQFCLKELNPVQSWILRELPRAGGIFGMISVGCGKSLSSVLAPMTMPERKKWVLLIKPDQRLHYRNTYLRAREHFRVPYMIFDKPDLNVAFVGDGYVTGDEPILHVIPYSTLSNPKSTLLLRSINPDGVIADESHCLSNRESVRTRRFLQYMNSRNGEIVFCNWSGSMVKKSLNDCSHLSAYALGLGSPYPIDPHEAERWAEVIDPSPMPDRHSGTAHDLKFAFGTKNDVQRAFFVPSQIGDDGVREGFRDRVVATLGVISTRSSSVTCSISITEHPCPKIPSTIREPLAGVRGDWLRPDGEELVEAIDQILCARHVVAGFFYRWTYPHGEPAELIDEWFMWRKLYHKELRNRLFNSQPYLDSPLHCFNAAERFWRVPKYEGELPVWGSEMWPKWSAIKDRVRPVPKAVWIDDYFARHVAEWAKENTAVVWCQSGALGRKIAELAGLPYHGGGPNAEKNILAEDGTRSVIASIKAHGSGRDGLQFKFSRQLIAEVPSSGDGMEQLLGRLAREGQEADTVDTEICLPASESRDALRKAVMYAEFIEATTPNRQLMLAADMDIDL